MSWNKLTPETLAKALSESSDTKEAEGKISRLRGVQTTWDMISRRWRHWRGEGRVLGKALDLITATPTQPKTRYDYYNAETILVLPDTQVRPGVPLDHLRQAGNLASDKGVDCVTHVGDHWDLPSFSSYETAVKKASAKASRRADIDAGNEGLHLFERGLQGHKPKKVFLEGNHDGFAPQGRIGRWKVENPWDADLITQDMFADGELGWERIPFLRTVEISGILFCHLFPVNKVGNVTQGAMRMGSTAATALRYNQQSCIAGHKQGFDYATTVVRDKVLHSIVAGSFYAHDEAYLGPQHYWRGVLLLRNCSQENPMGFDFELISMERLAKEYS